jgi:cytochrome c-type biogenesis protein CcmF
VFIYPLVIPGHGLQPSLKLLLIKPAGRDLGAASQRLMAAAVVALAVSVLLLALHERGPWFAPFGIGLGVWLILGALTEVAYRVKLTQSSPAEAWRRCRNLPRAAYGTALAHAGLGLAVIGIVATTTWRSEAILALKPGDTAEIAGYTLAF